MMIQYVYRALFLAGLNLTFLNQAWADHLTPAGFSADISKPSPSVEIALPQTAVTKASAESSAQWQNYDRPIRECIEGEAIIPANNNKVLSYLFGNQADTNVTLSILGWKKNQCQIEFKEATLVKSCRFTRGGLKILMDNLLNADLFNTSSAFAQTLSTACETH